MVVVMKKVSENYVKNAKEARKEHKGGLVLDISVKGGMGFLSPEFNWRGIEIPGVRYRGMSVMGIYEGLKSFKNRKEVDEKYFTEERYLGKKRGCKSYGVLEGFWWDGEKVSVEDGIERIKGMYIKEVERRYGRVIERLREENKNRDIILLEDRDDEMKIPFSHGEILKSLIEMEAA